MAINRGHYLNFASKLERLALSRRATGSIANEESKKPTIFTFERRRVIVPLVNKHKALLLEKMPGLDLKELVDSIEIIFEDKLNKYTAANNVDWVDNKHDSLIFSNLKAMEEVLARFRTEIRQLAIINVNKSKRTSFQKEEDIGVSLILGGIDPRYESEGGDIRSSDLKNGILITKGKTSKEGAIGNNRLANLSKERGTGFQAGHAFGSGIEQIKAFTGSRANPSPILSLFSTDVQSQLLGFKRQAVKVDVSMVINLRLLSRAGKKQGEVVVIFAEHTKSNRVAGTILQRQILDPMKKLLKEQSVELKKELNKLITTYSDSPTILEEYIEAIEYLFLNGKLKRKNSRKTFKVRKNLYFDIPEYGPKIKPTKKRRKRKESDDAEHLDLRGLIVKLNSKLHDKIRENMGKGRSRKTLNYRTGRFARSAKIETLYSTRRKGEIGARVKYMRNPYSVFEIGGKLNPPKLRDPAGIFGRSIRQILQEEKIAKLSRVKVTLSG